MLFIVAGTISAQGGKDWTPWTPVVGGWAEFYVFTEFRGKERTPEELAKTELKSLRVDCFIVGRIAGNVPDEIRGVKAFKVIYKDYGMFRNYGLNDDSRLVYYDKDGKLVPPATIRRAATQFDVDQARNATADIKVTTVLPSFGVWGGPEDMKSKVSGRRYRVPVEWRRKGSTVELRLKHYAPADNTSVTDK